MSRSGLELLPETTESEDGLRRHRTEALPPYPAAGSFKGDAEANALIAPPYHNGWRRPTA